jgi:hypothetical protein
VQGMNIHTKHQKQTQTSVAADKQRSCARRHSARTCTQERHA